MSTPVTSTDPRHRLHHLFDTQRRAMLADPVPSLERRLDRIDRVRRLVVDGEARIRTAKTNDFGSLHTAMVVMLDTLPVIERVNHISTHLTDWMRPKDVDLGPAHGSSRGQVLRCWTWLLVDLRRCWSTRRRVVEVCWSESPQRIRRKSARSVGTSRRRIGRSKSDSRARDVATGPTRT